MDANAQMSTRPPTETQDFSEAAVCARMEELRRYGLNQALPRLMLELDGILNAKMPAEQRVALMQCLKKPVVKAVTSLPKPAARGSSAPAAGSAGMSMTLEQRLLLIMSRNLRQALFELDRSQASILMDESSERLWVMQQAFRFIGRQLRYGIDWDRPWPKHTWQDLHDLFVYLVVRGTVQMHSGFTVAVFDEEFEPEIEYKRLLLLGLADRLTQRRCQTSEYFHLLKRWALESRLQEPERALGDTNYVKVDVVRDEPPRVRQGPLKESFRGWILRPNRAFFDYVEQVRCGGDLQRFHQPQSGHSSYSNFF